MGVGVCVCGFCELWRVGVGALGRAAGVATGHLKNDTRPLMEFHPPPTLTTLPRPKGAYQSMPLQSPLQSRPSRAHRAHCAHPDCRTCVLSCASYIWRLRSPDVFFALRRPWPRPGFRLGKTSSPPTTFPPPSSPKTISPDASRARLSVRLSPIARAAASMKREASSRSMSSSPPRKFISCHGEVGNKQQQYVKKAVLESTAIRKPILFGSRSTYCTYST